MGLYESVARVLYEVEFKSLNINATEKLRIQELFTSFLNVKTPDLLEAKHRIFEEYSLSLPELVPSQPTVPSTLPNFTPVTQIPNEPEFELTDDQSKAWSKLQTWVTNDKPYFVLRGFAGTGKTFLMQKLVGIPGITVFFTAPTNKATKVLSTAVGVPARTIFSFLGLKMVHDEDRLVLEYAKEPPYVPRGAIILVDEASQTGEQLVGFLDEVQERTGCKVLYVGDPAQLRPIGELRSLSWSVTKEKDCRASLKEVVRQDNQLLALSMRIRQCLIDKDWVSPLVNDNAEGLGVFKITERKFEQRLLSHSVEDFVDTKVIAWRNKTVDAYTRKIRQGLGYEHEYTEGEIIWLKAPIEIGGTIVAHTDEEFRVHGRKESKVMIGDDEIQVYLLDARGDTQQQLYVPVIEAQLGKVLTHKSHVARTASTAKARKAAWTDFWATKNRFHMVRYGYALTAHRGQGSTYKIVYVDQSDILRNKEKQEAFQCLYVGCTRPTDVIVSF